MSIRYKIALLFALLVTIILAMVSVSVYFFSVSERSSAFKNRLRNRAFSTAKVYDGITDTNYSILRRVDATAVSSLYNKSITVADNYDQYRYCYTDSMGDSLLLTKEIIDLAKINKEHYFNFKNKKAVAIHHIDDESNFIVAVAALDTDGQEYLQQLKKILLIALLLAVLLSYIAGLIFAKRLIEPIKNITSEVNQITSDNIARRIKISGNKDELTKLAETFNNLLQRLQHSFYIQRQFISNASHELSTPLTSVLSQLEVALQKDRSPEAYKEVMHSIYEDMKNLQQLTRSLLDIAKTGSGGSIDLQEVRLDEVLFKVVSDIKKQNPQFRITLKLNAFPDNEKLLTVFGNTNLLYIALKNIIENGCKYSSSFEATVTASFDKKDIVIQVINDGDIIVEEDLQDIFQPFFRTDTARQKPGFGLGLTLTKGILALHKSNISVRSDNKAGTIFTLRLPNIAASL